MSRLSIMVSSNDHLRDWKPNLDRMSASVGYYPHKYSTDPDVSDVDEKLGWFSYRLEPLGNGILVSLPKTNKFNTEIYRW